MRILVDVLEVTIPSPEAESVAFCSENAAMQTNSNAKDTTIPACNALPGMMTMATTVL
jgi:hypothetical protein